MIAGKFSFKARIIGVAAMPAMLSACFLAENDEQDPIIPDSELAYPIAMGNGRECQLNEEGEEECAPARFEKAGSGAYQLTVFTEGENGNPVPTDSGEFKLRRLQGEGIPEQTFLAQQVSRETDQRFLGLLVKRGEGGWLKIDPQCENLPVQAFVRFINDRWLQTREGEDLSDLVCFFRRDGLTDERIYTVLHAASGVSNTVYYAE
jgi:hypothetical protein